MTRHHDDTPVTSSKNRQIANSIIWVTLFVVVGKGFGALKEIAIAYRFGVGSEVSIFIYWLNILTFPVTVWFSALSAVLVPTVIRCRIEFAAYESQFLGELNGLTFLVGMTLFVFIIPLYYAFFITSGDVAIGSMRIANFMLLATTVPVGLFVGLYSAWTMADGSRRNTLFEAIPAIVMVISLISSASRYAPPLIIGATLGVIIHLVALLLPYFRRLTRTQMLFTRSAPQWVGFWRSFTVVVAGQAFASFTILADQSFASRIDISAVALLNYSNRLHALILALGATVISRSTLPVFSSLVHSRASFSQLKDIVWRWVGIMFFYGLFAAIIGYLFAPLAIKILFQHGSFTKENSSEVVSLFRAGLAQLPFYFSALVLVSLLASLQKYGLIAISGILNLIVKVVSSWILIPVYGVIAINFASGIMYLASFLALATYCVIRFNDRPI